MKHTFNILRGFASVALTLTVVLLLGACKDDKKEADTPVFPETQLLNCQVGEKKVLEFTAPTDWKLSATQSWCKFVVNEKTELSVSGTAGKQSVTLSISDEGQTQGSGAVAYLKLYMQGHVGILAEVHRSAAGYELKVYDADGNEVNYVKVGYNTYSTFRVKANFPFAATIIPEWAELLGGTLTGSPNVMVESGLRVIPNGTVEKYAKEASLIFQDTKGMASIQVKVIYEGMDRDVISITRPTGGAWNWNVDASGQKWTHEGNTYDRFIECPISAYNDDYEIIYVEEVEGDFTLDCDWMTYNKTSSRITVAPAEASRKGYVMAFPRAKYDEIKDQLPDVLFEEEEGKKQIAYLYQQNNVVVQIIQEVKGEEEDNIGFKAMCFTEDWELLMIDCKRVTDSEKVAQCEAITGSRDLYLLDTPSPRGFFDQVRPWPLLSNSDDLSGGVYFMDMSGTVVEDPTPEPSFMDSENPPYWYVMGCRNTGEKPLYLVLMNKDGMSVMKVLLIDTK
ncbi:MAG: DUF5003 domain-containing protein [Bacteroidaceae bacterium]|nr:DUF5003 domain-containing protein [Bacteroidaceae bacterium]